MNLKSEPRGSTEFLTAAALLKDLYQRRATGEVTFTRGEAEKRLFLKGGFIIYAASNREEDRLGDILLKHGLISRRHFEESLRKVGGTGKKHGTVLVQMGALSPRQLFSGLTLQVREIVLSLFEWREGSWQFLDRLPPGEEIISLRIPPVPLILEGVLLRASRREWFLENWNPRNRSFSLHPDPPWTLDDLGLPPEAAKVAALVEKGTPWERMPPLLGMSEADTAAFLYSLSLLEILASSPAGEPAAAPEGKRPVGDADAPPLPSRERIRQLAEKVERLNLYQVLRLEPGASIEAVKNAFIALAKEYHPDRFFPAEYDDVRAGATTVFMKINEAYSVLSNPGKRAEYDRTTIHLEVSRGKPAEPDKDSRIAREQYLKGMKSLEAGDLWSAAEAFRWATNLNPRVAVYHAWLGAALARTKKRLHEAEHHCKTAITLDYSNPLFYVHLGRVYRAGKLPQKAKQQFETALKLKPGFAEAEAELRDLSAEEGRQGLAGRLFRK